MQHAIDVDDEVFNYLERHARVFVDTPNTVLRRLFGFDTDEQHAVHTPDAIEAGPGRPRSESTIRAVELPNGARAAPGTILAESEYELPTLRFLLENGGRASSRHVIDAVGVELDAAGRLTKADKEVLKSGEVRWRSRAAFARKHLVQRGEVDGAAPRGIWVITEKGRRRVQDGLSEAE
jgi:hypothetical protein